MREFDYVSPDLAEEVIRLLWEDAGPERGPYPASLGGETRPLAGGTDLLTLMKADVAAPARLVNIKGLNGRMRGIEEREGGVSLGALTTLSDIERSPLIRRRFPALSEAAEVAATPQLRNMATLGGNLLQRPRCWYFRNHRSYCWLKGGDDCPAFAGENQFHALFGGGPCYAVHPSDLAPALVALDAEVRLQGPGGERALPLAEFFTLPSPDRRTETAIAGNELLVSVRIPPLPEGARSTYLKAMDRKVWAFALVGVAAVLRMDPDGRRIRTARLVLSGVAPIPWPAGEAERLLAGSELSQELIERAAHAAVAGAGVLQENGYKVPLAKALVQRALEALAGHVPPA